MPIDIKSNMSEQITVNVDPLAYGQRNLNSENKPEQSMPAQAIKGRRRIPKNPRKNGILNRQARMIIYNVNRYLKKEAEEGIKNIKQIQKRTAEATDTSVHTVRRILKEGSSILTKANTTDLLSELNTSGKKREKTVTDMSSYDQGVIKRCIHNFHITEKVLPSMLKLRIKLANDIKFQGSERSLRRIINRLGFRWKRTENNKKLLIEKSDIRFKRIEYLQRINKYRQDGRPIIYTGETFIDTCNPTQKTDESKVSKKQISKGQRIAMVHAGSELGFIPNSLLIFKGSNTKNGDDLMSYENYKRWLRTQLLPNLPNNSVVVIDNAPYHNKQYDPSPTSNAKLIDMQTWLSERRIYYTEDMLKPQLYNLIKNHKKQEKIYSIDQLLAENNHEVLRLPPYHPDLNPIELAWSAIKWYIGKITTWNPEGITELIKEKVTSLGPNEWNLLCNKVREIEEQYRRSDHVVDMLTEKFIIQVNDDDSGSDAESPSASCDDASDDDEVILPTSSNCNSDDLVKAFPFPLYP